MQKSFLREFAGVVMRAAVVLVTIVLVFFSIGALYEVESNISDGSCNVAVLPVEGAILPFYGLAGFDLAITPEIVENFMDAAENERNIKAVLVEINSPGGTPVASQRIAERFRNSSLPVVGLIGDIGASGGYMVAAATDWLIASPMSTVGSIGVTMSYLEESQKNEEEGITYVDLNAGEFKDAGSPYKPLSEEEREMFEQDLQIVYDEFVDIVAEYRDMERSDVLAVADGSTMPGRRALDSGLIDAVGGRAEAHGTLAGIMGVGVEEVRFCEYKSGLLPF